MTEDNAELRTIDKLTGRMRWFNKHDRINTAFYGTDLALQQEWQTRKYNGNIWTGEEKLWWQDVPTVENE